jgi:hypothetical protein
VLGIVEKSLTTLMKQMDRAETLQTAIELIDLLSLEDQTALIGLLQERLRQQKNQNLVCEIQEIRQEVAQGAVQFGSVSDFLAEIDD